MQDEVTRIPERHPTDLTLCRGLGAGIAPVLVTVGNARTRPVTIAVRSYLYLSISSSARFLAKPHRYPPNSPVPRITR
jgi:hypothetical protein